MWAPVLNGGISVVEESSCPLYLHSIRLTGITRGDKTTRNTGNSEKNHHSRNSEENAKIENDAVNLRTPLFREMAAHQDSDNENSLQDRYM